MASQEAEGNRIHLWQGRTAMEREHEKWAMETVRWGALLRAALQLPGAKETLRKYYVVTFRREK